MRMSTTVIYKKYFINQRFLTFLESLFGQEFPTSGRHHDQRLEIRFTTGLTIKTIYILTFDTKYKLHKLVNRTEAAWIVEYFLRVIRNIYL